MALHADEHVAYVVEGVHPVEPTRRHHRLEHGEVVPSHIVADEEEVLSTERESQFILPMSASTP